jgi:homopolymeric O-antigen transport system permease protein
VAAPLQDRLVLIDDAMRARPVSSPAGPRHFQTGWAELVEGGRSWRVWHLMGIGELRRRYARSRMGQFWLTLSTGITIAIIGATWALLWKIPLADMLPFLAISMVVWQLLSGIVGDATTAFSANAHYLLSQRLPCATAVFALIYRNLVVLLHNAVIVAIVLLVFGRPVSLAALLVVPALLLTAVAAVWWAYVVATLCARFRDLVHAVQSLLQLAFYVTPIIWKPEFLPEEARWLNLVNPFAVYVGIIRDPLMGEPPALLPWLIAAGIAFGGLALALGFIGRYRRRVLYWI